MSRIIRIVTSSLATLEHVHPPYNIRIPGVEENVRLAEELLTSAAAYDPDLVLLPETFALAGMSAAEIEQVAEPADGPIHQMLSSMAQAGHMNIVAGHLVRDGSRVANRALVFDRSGSLVTTYDKMHPVGNERLAGVAPGKRPGIAELDVGTIGLAICFDINWPGIWAEFAAREVDLVAWISAYDGGFPLQSYAWQHQYPIVSSVYTYNARLYDIAGDAVTLTSRWQRLGMCELNLDRALFHTDNQMERIIDIQKRYGDQVSVRSYTEEHLFILESRAPERSVADIISEFGLETYRDYIRRCTEPPSGQP